MKTTAAILVDTNQPLRIVELDTPVLKPGQTLVEILYSGICHTQLLEARGFRGEDKFLPHCLGHEGVGTVVEVGEGVCKVRPGDQVILSWIKGSGADISGCQYRWEDKAVNSGAITTFGKHSVISENRLTLLPPGVPLKEAALIGCAVATGAGAVLNTAKPNVGQSIAVFGAGGVGLFSIAAAKAIGMAPILAVDINERKLAMARRMGATHMINSSVESVDGVLRQLCPKGTDIAIEASGRPEVMAMALESVRQQGGKAVVIGNAHYGERLNLDPRQLNQGKQLLGTWGGDSRPDEDYPKYCHMLRYGLLNLSPLTEEVYSLLQVNQAIHDLETGKVIRPLLDMSLLE